MCIRVEQQQTGLAMKRLANNGKDERALDTTAIETKLEDR